MEKTIGDLVADLEDASEDVARFRQEVLKVQDLVAKAEHRQASARRALISAYAGRSLTKDS